MSEWAGYATSLNEKFTFVNTQYHTEPRLDITDYKRIPYRDMDFVICSEVFEHVKQPLVIAFGNLFSIVKPGGSLVFSAPYVDAARTIEHFPEIFEYEVVQFKGQFLILNRTAAGEYEIFDNPIFHGGAGAVLEMRIFCEQDLVRGLRSAGFVDVKIHDQPNLSVGYYWPAVVERPPPFQGVSLGYIISALRPG